MSDAPLKILLVEDSRSDALLLQGTLKDVRPGAFDFHWVDRTEKAVHQIQKGVFDAILLDMTLPDTQGLETLKHVQDVAKGVPLIVLTGLEDENLAVQAIRHGAQDYLVKGAVNGVGIDKAIRFAIDRKKIELRIAKLTKLYAVLSEVNEAIVRTQEESALYQEVCRIVSEVGGFPLVWIGLVEEGQVVPAAWHGPAADYLKEIKVAVQGEWGGGPTGACIRENWPVVNHDYDKNDAVAPWRELAQRHGLRSSAAFPLSRQGWVFGALTLSSSEAYAFDPEHVDLLKALCADISYAAVVFDQEQLRRRIEVSLRESEERLKHALDAGELGTWELDVGTGNVWRSLRHDQILGYSKHQRDWTMETFFDHVFSEDRPHVEEQFRQAVAHGTEWRCSCRIRRADGDTRWILVRGKPHRDDREATVKMVGLLRDVTPQKEAEEILKRDNVTLEKMVHERTQDLLKIRSELENAKRLSDIGTLAATVAHELRNPLAAINLAAANIKRKSKDPALDKHLGNIEKKVAESNQIINNLLFYSRLKSPHVEEVVLHDILEECAGAVEEKFKKNIVFRKKYGAIKDLMVAVDPLQMKEIFHNILNNAHDAVPEEKGEIEIGAIHDEREVHIHIRDNGSGIDKENLEKVFDPFFTTKAKGTGLGLSVCRQLVTLHEGTIHIESERGKGTLVKIALPRKRAVEKP